MICEHGQLKRQCPLCEKDEEIAALERERDEARLMLRQLSDENDRLFTENAALKKSLGPFKELWRKGDDYIITHIDEVRIALMKCMEIEGE